MATDREILEKLGCVGYAFFGSFQSFREVQRRAIPPILEGKNVLLCSATASGKTEAVMAPIVARIFEQGNKQTCAIRVLVIAPTRALVNDLYTRLEDPLSQMKWSCGRQTSDHRDKYRQPEVLITTPESFDSMLARDATWQGSRLEDHLLSGVDAVFIDEAHLFEATPRGDQLIWLLERLKRIRSYACRQGWIKAPYIQVCASSATVARPVALSRRLLGKDSQSVVVAGIREMEIFNDDPIDRWVHVSEIQSLAQFAEKVQSLKEEGEQGNVTELFWRVIEQGAEENVRKLLVFVPSRALCDMFSTEFMEVFSKKRELFVAGHHGSLQRAMRENAERQFMKCRDSVLIATSTMEVGIDIGDVDVVGLVGAPQDTAALLQRIGRSGRKRGCIRLVALARNPFEAAALASMLETASQGGLEPKIEGRRWSVFIQQTFSYTAQAGKRGRRRSDLLDLAQAVWPEAPVPETAAKILDNLVENGLLFEHNGRYYLGDMISDRFHSGSGDIHSNFQDAGQPIAVVDATTGETLVHVMERPRAGLPVALAGQTVEVLSSSKEVLVKISDSEDQKQLFQYTRKGMSPGKVFAEHVRRGLGFDSRDAPMLEMVSGGFLWLHFGGSAYEVILRQLLPEIRLFRRFTGLAVRGLVTEDALIDLTRDISKIYSVVKESEKSLRSILSVGRFHGQLPDDVRENVVLQLFDCKEFIDWLQSRKIWVLDRSHPLLMTLRDLQ